MILIGRYASPFVRRVAVSMNYMGIKFEHKALSTASDTDAIKTYNPMAKVPVLITPDGQALVDSAAILDTLCDITPGQKLLPASGQVRRNILQQAAIMTNVLDKAVQHVYEPLKRPAEKVHQPFLDGLVDQVAAGLDMLEIMAAKGEISSGEQANLAGITIAVGWKFLQRVLPKAALADRHPSLAKHSQICEALPAFKACQSEV